MHQLYCIKVSVNGLPGYVTKYFPVPGTDVVYLEFSSSVNDALKFRYRMNAARISNFLKRKNYRGVSIVRVWVNSNVAA
jgi:hypothetical protein